MTANPFYAYTQTPIETITPDPAFGDGWYESNADLRAALHHHIGVWFVMGFSTGFWKNEG